MNTELLCPSYYAGVHPLLLYTLFVPLSELLLPEVSPHLSPGVSRALSLSLPPPYLSFLFLP